MCRRARTAVRLELIRLRLKAQIMDEAAVLRALMRIAHEIEERNGECGELCLIGVCRRGAPLAEQIAKNIRSFSGINVLVGQLDIQKYRDDHKSKRIQCEDRTKIDFSVEDKTVVLVDDVIHTGRTVRAAMDGLMKYGRPAKIQLAVLIDRGHRELPIRGDFVGKNVPTARDEIVRVCLPGLDPAMGVQIYTKDD